MILVKRKHLYITTALFSLVLIYGEIKFFFALRAANLTGNLDVKYQAENFIFAAVILFLVVYLFLVHFMKASQNVLRTMDKMIELSEYGEHDVRKHLGQLGDLGGKVSALIQNLDDLNKMKTLKISAVSGINDILVTRSREMLLVADRVGTITQASGKLLEAFSESKDGVVGRNISDLFAELGGDRIFGEMESTRNTVVVEKPALALGDKGRVQKVFFYPVINAGGDISNVIVVIER